MLSVVIPAFNEQEGIAQLADELVAAFAHMGADVELILVDDGSTDGTWQAMRDVAARFPRTSLVRLRRNFGKAAALDAGVHAAQGEIIATLDADGQDDPAEVSQMLATLAADADIDVVVGWKKRRNDPWTRRAASAAWNRALGALTGLRLHDHNCGLKCVRRAVFDEIPLHGGLHRFVPVLAHARGFGVREQAVNHRARRHGRSKYGAGRYAAGLIDLFFVRLLTAFEGRPQHLLGAAGALLFLLGGGALFYLAGTWVAQLWDPHGYQPIMRRPLTIFSTVAFLFGAQTMFIGYVAGLIVHDGARRRPAPVREMVAWRRPDP